MQENSARIKEREAALMAEMRYIRAALSGRTENSASASSSVLSFYTLLPLLEGDMQLHPAYDMLLCWRMDQRENEMSAMSASIPMSKSKKERLTRLAKESPRVTCPPRPLNLKPLQSCFEDQLRHWIEIHVDDSRILQEENEKIQRRKRRKASEYIPRLYQYIKVTNPLRYNQDVPEIKADEENDDFAEAIADVEA